MGDDSRLDPIARACVLAILAACSKSPGESSVLQASDLQGNGASFDPDEIVDSASMQDQTALDEAAVLAFLQKTPYGSSSFLATYASNSVPATQAIALASERYALNPLVFLVRAQMDDGLIGSTTYPSPSTRVEYAFGCGCIAPGQCDAAYAGFDVQVDCLGAALRESLDAVAASGKTDGGWGPGVTSTTLDGVAVTPKDDSTSALYQYTPVVAVGQAGGNWLFWNLWRKYAAFVGYGGAKNPPPSSWIGDACTASSACVYGATAGTCATQFPGGLCTLACTGSCPTAMGQAQTFCASFGSQGGFCLPVCDPADPQCRTGYGCKSVAQAGSGGTSKYVCFPD
jgi:hypothetical protein